VPYLTEKGRIEALARIGRKDLPAAGVVPKSIQGTLRAALAADLDREARLYQWTTYGNDQQVLGANATVNIPIRIDPSAWFVAKELHFRSSLNAIDCLVQVVRDGDMLLFRSAAPFSALMGVAQGVARGRWPLPREWVFRPGGTATIVLTSRNGTAPTVDCHLGGYHVRI